MSLYECLGMHRTGCHPRTNRSAARLGLSHSSSLTAQEMDFLFGERAAEEPSHAFLHAEKSGHLLGMSVLNATAMVSGSTESYPCFRFINTYVLILVFHMQVFHLSCLHSNHNLSISSSIMFRQPRRLKDLPQSNAQNDKKWKF